MATLPNEISIKLIPLIARSIHNGIPWQHPHFYNIAVFISRNWHTTWAVSSYGKVSINNKVLSNIITKLGSNICANVIFEVVHYLTMLSENDQETLWNTLTLFPTLWIQPPLEPFPQVNRLLQLKSLDHWVTEATIK